MCNNLHKFVNLLHQSTGMFNRCVAFIRKWYNYLISTANQANGIVDGDIDAAGVIVNYRVNIIKRMSQFLSKIMLIFYRTPWRNDTWITPPLLVNMDEFRWYTFSLLLFFCVRVTMSTLNNSGILVLLIRETWHFMNNFSCNLNQ